MAGGPQVLARQALLVAGGALLAITITWWESDGLVVVGTQRPFDASAFSLMLALAAAITVVLQIPVSRLTRSRAPALSLATGGVVRALGLGTLMLAGAGPLWLLAVPLGVLGGLAGALAARRGTPKRRLTPAVSCAGAPPQATSSISLGEEDSPSEPASTLR